MASRRTIARVERLAWILLYAGLLAIVLGLATRSAHAPSAWTLIVAGAVLAAAGTALIWVRSRLEPGD
ncbi:hypothetical protein RAMLITH_02090 [Ramlibacter sp. RBP-2]|uniref:Uncharacterized protein n=1 Tax=Ramlibacter lithotrophicus TaxID=2606681 RepID=A0A7X6I505_9BURK|nr:hypothetical protein [Ramlibacter lithotrophicus]